MIGCCNLCSFPVAKDSVRNWISEVYCPYKYNVLDAVQHILRCDYYLDFSRPANHTFDLAVRCSE